MNRIEQTYLISAPVEEVWRALTDPAMIAEWSGSSAIYSAEPEMDYALWDCTISGRILHVHPHERIQKTWKPNNWERADSVVTIMLTPIEGGTRIDLIHENVEETDFEGTREGWDIYYLGAIKRMYEDRAPKAMTLSVETGSKPTRPAPKKPARKKLAKKKATPKTIKAKNKNQAKSKTKKKTVTPKKKVTGKRTSRK